MHKKMVSSSYPRISIVTPSFNQGQFLEETIRSVLLQNYPNLEYMIIDGGSKDQSLDIISKYKDQLAYWVSEPDNGQYDGINKGFSKCTGEIMAYINSDDKYVLGCLDVVAEIFASIPQVEWLTSRFPLIWDERGRATDCSIGEGFARRAFFRGRNLPRKGDPSSTIFIQQESTFWRRSLWERAGGRLDASLRLAGDFELWARFWKSDGLLYAVEAPLAGFRRHHLQKTASMLDAYYAEAERVLAEYGGRRMGPIQGWSRLGLRLCFSPWLLRYSGLTYKGKTLTYQHEEHAWKVQERHFI